MRKTDLACPHGTYIPKGRNTKLIINYRPRVRKNWRWEQPAIFRKYKVNPRFPYVDIPFTDPEASAGCLIIF